MIGSPVGELMFELMLLSTAAIALIGMAIAYDGSRDVFHPMLYIGPMLFFIYGWMPWKLLQADGLERFFDMEQLHFVQTLNILGVLAFVIACLSVGVRLDRSQAKPMDLSLEMCRRLLVGSLV